MSKGQEGKHTPGPWKFDNNFGPPYVPNIEDNEGRCIAIIWKVEENLHKKYSYCHESRANAKLIAKAPEMYEEIKSLKVKVLELEAKITNARAEIVRRYEGTNINPWKDSVYRELV